MPAFIPPLVAAAAALLMEVAGIAPPGQTARVAYISGTIGTLVGARQMSSIKRSAAKYTPEIC